jgi:hypothetical protein
MATRQPPYAQAIGVNAHHIATTRASLVTAAGSSARATSNRVDREDSWHSIATPNAALLSDDDNRCRRVFLHLEALCTTHEARSSLYAWQQGYARQTGREALLPRGGSMVDKAGGGLVTRLFSGGGRQSFAADRERPGESLSHDVSRFENKGGADSLKHDLNGEKRGKRASIW